MSRAIAANAKWRRRQVKRNKQRKAVNHVHHETPASMAPPPRKDP